MKKTSDLEKLKTKSNFALIAIIVDTFIVAYLVWNDLMRFDTFESRMPAYPFLLFLSILVLLGLVNWYSIMDGQKARLEKLNNDNFKMEENSDFQKVRIYLKNGTSWDITSENNTPSEKTIWDFINDSNKYINVGNKNRIVTIPKENIAFVTITNGHDDI